MLHMQQVTPPGRLIWALGNNMNPQGSAPPLQSRMRHLASTFPVPFPVPECFNPFTIPQNKTLAKTSTSMRFINIAKQFVATYPGLTAGNLAIAMTLTPVHDVLLPHLYGKLVSVVENGGDYKRPMILVLVTVGLVQLFSFMKDCIDMETQPRLFDFVRTRMMESLLGKYEGDLVEPPTGTVVSTVTRSPEIISWWVEVAVDMCVPYIFAFTTAAVYFYLYDGWLSLALVSLLVCLILLLVYAPRKCLAESIAREQALQQCHEQIDDTLRNVVSVYSSEAIPGEMTRLRERGAVFQAAHKRAMQCMLIYKGIGVPLVIIFFSTVLVRCCQLVKSKQISKGTFVSLFMVTTSLVNTFAWMVTLVKSTTLDTGTLVNSEAMCSRLNESDVVSDGGNTPQENLGPEGDGIGFLHVTYTQPGSVIPIVDDLTCNFDRGQRTLITGGVGTGKSTLLRLLMGFVVPGSGDMYMSGHMYRTIGAKHVRRQIAFMPQDAVLFDRTILENVLYGNRGKGERDVTNVMDIMGIRAEFEAMPQGIHTRCKKGGSGLSGGQKQLVFFMRVMLRNPQFIILDEPTASMDTRTKHLLMKSLRILSKDKTVIMISHDPEVISFATRRLDWPPPQ